MHILGLIPARGGSKGIAGKNLSLLAGRPLLSYTCEAAKSARSLTRTIISTDDQAIADAAKRCSMEVPFLRPSALAADDTPMSDVITHALDTLRSADGFAPDVVVLLQPTSPLRTAKHIDEAIALLESTGADTVVSVTEVPHQFHPQKLMQLVDGRLVPVSTGVAPRRQDTPKLFARNGPAILVLRTATLDASNFYVGDTRAYVMRPEESVDIDTSFDLQLAEVLLQQAQ